MNDPLKLVTFVAVFAVAFTLLVYFLKFIGKRKLDMLQELTSPAKLIFKSTEAAGKYTTTRYHLTFELGDQQRKTFTVNYETYGEILENETGMLTYKEQGKLLFFISFQRTE